MSSQRPFVILNAAMTLDGKIDTVARGGAPISSERDWERVDMLRAESDAIMVGGHTLLGDDPKLVIKSPLLRAGRTAGGLCENPIKVGIVTKINDPKEGPTLRDDSNFITAGPARRIIFTTEQTDSAQIGRLRDLGVDVFVMGTDSVDLAAALDCLGTLGVRRLLVEGGATLNADMLRNNLINEIYLYIAPLIFGGASAPTLVDGAGFEHENALKLKLLHLQQVDEGAILLHYGCQKRET